jgi:two-component system, OmpR family, KDP operon response regulator KdpE
VAKVLAVDDETQILTALARGLQRAGHEVLVARTGEDGLAAAAVARPDVVLLDLRLPDLDGIEVVRRLRGWSAVPIVLLSGEGSERARVQALDAGADDFVDKPFSREELRARLSALLRRSGAEANGTGTASIRHHGAPGRIVDGGVAIDLAARRLTIDGHPVRLTPTEWRLLIALASAPDRLLTYRQVITAVWDERHGDEARESLRVHLRTLRSKLGDKANEPRFVATEPGVGYRWIGSEAS